MNTILKRIEEKLNNKNVMITNADDVFYMTRFRSSNLRILYINGEWYGVTDPRYTEAAKDAMKGFKIINMLDTNWLANLIKETNITDIYVNELDTTIASMNNLDKAFKQHGVEVKSFNYGYLRDAYTEEDIKSLEIASEINDDLIMKVINYVEPGMTELDVEAFILKSIIDSKAEGPSFEPIVASGPNSSKPHWSASDRVIEEGELITIDMGVVYNGFCSDMTRTFSIGEAKDDEATKIWNIVKETMETSIELIKDGANCYDIHMHAVNMIDSYGYKEYFQHGLGHGLGVEIHDKPAFNHLAKNDFLKEGMVMTIEPGIYLPGKFGVRLEQAILVTKDGYKILNNAPVELVKKV